ncbi:MAG: membrane dipeptidase [Burkholderiales bacterium]
MNTIYADSIVFDGLNICNWSREIFLQWKKGGITGVSCTCAIWENFRDSMHNIIRWRRLFEENADLILQVRTTADLRRAKAEGRTGVVLSWQNTAGIEDRIDFLQIFNELGVRIMQLTYNTQNYSGAGYTELADSGLTGFGREVVDEMARVGIVCDLSHVGPRTSADTIAYAKKPPCFSHVLPQGMRNTPRNKSDELIRALADRGGMIGLSQFGPFMKRGNESTIADYVEALEYVIDLAGEDHVGIGSDASQGHGRPSPFMEWCNHDKGYARELTPFGHDKVVKPLGDLAERARLADAMQAAGWSESRMRKVLGENWLAYLRSIWGE